MKEVWKGNELNGRKQESGATRSAVLSLIFDGVRSYKLLISFEMFAGIFQAKAVRLVLYWTSVWVSSLVEAQRCAVSASYGM